MRKDGCFEANRGLAAGLKRRGAQCLRPYSNLLSAACYVSPGKGSNDLRELYIRNYRIMIGVVREPATDLRTGHTGALTSESALPVVIRQLTEHPAVEYDAQLVRGLVTVPRTGDVQPQVFGIE